jgi:uncharacterized cupin superfamily protein
MGIGFCLQGRRRDPGGLIERWLREAPEGERAGPVRKLAGDMAEFLREAAGDHYLGHHVEEQEPGVFAIQLRMHSAGDPLEIVVTERGEFQASAKTSAVGPGFHIRAVEIVRRVAERFAIDFGPFGQPEDHFDETGFFDSGDREAVLRHFTRFAAQMGSALGHHLANGAERLRLNMPVGVDFAMGTIQTPLGPRDAAWARDLAEGAQPIDTLYPWAGTEEDARCWRGHALAAMWTEVRWRIPIDDEETALLSRIDQWLERAHQMDPGMELPWHEWEEILGYLNRRSRFAARIAEMTAEPPEGPRIGYRRQPVRRHIGEGWSLIHDGAMIERYDERGNILLADAASSIHVTLLMTKGDGQREWVRQTAAQAAMQEGLGTVEVEGDGCFGSGVGGRLVTDEDDGRRAWQMTLAFAGGGKGVLVLTLTCDEELGEAWATKVLKTVSWAAPRSG